MNVKLSDAEWKIMNILWDGAPRTMMEITNLLKEDTGWTRYTVITYLKRLGEKGALHYEEGGRAKLYYPDITRDDTVISETEEFIERVFQGKLGLLLNAMAAKTDLTDEEARELYDILEKRNRK